MDHQAYECVGSFEQFLGNPQSENTVFSYKNSLIYDRQEAFPNKICQQLNAFGLQKYYVPAEFGGALNDYQQLLMLMRLVARRDLTVAIGHGKTYLGAVCVWVGGTPEQATSLGQVICQGGIVSLALTERGHGSDILANELSATESDGGFCLNGEKWLINNANRSHCLTVFVKTSQKGGSRGYSIFLAEKEQLSPSSYTCLDKIKTHGIRGADISGIQFHDAWVASTALVNKLGYGLEIMLKSLQITRTLCSSLSLGAADNALRVVSKFAFNRQLYNKSLSDLPHARQILLNSFADHLICEVLGIASVRAIHLLTEQMSLVSACAKYFIPTRVDTMIEQLGILLGARAFLLEEYEYGRFQKLERDHRLVGLFDGNTLVNLQMIINQLKSLAQFRQQFNTQLDIRGVDLFTITHQLPTWNRERLSLTTKGQDTILNNFFSVAKQIEVEVDQTSPHMQAIQYYLRQLIAEINRFDDEVLKTDWMINSIPTQCFSFAQRYSILYAASACTQMWFYNHLLQQANRFQPMWQEGIWLRVCLERLLSQLHGDVNPSHQANNILFDIIKEQYNNHFLFSLFSLELSENSMMSSDCELNPTGSILC
jgi:alkylation response protein AidB-like acyl-CoA dehydrogenase